MTPPTEQEQEMERLTRFATKLAEFVGDPYGEGPPYKGHDEYTHVSKSRFEELYEAARLLGIATPFDAPGYFVPPSASADVLRLLSSRQGEPDEARTGCPCTLVEPCSPRCSCAHPVQSGGCRRCCRYGSLEQRTAKAKALAAIDHAPSSSQQAGSPEGMREKIEALIADWRGAAEFADRDPDGDRLKLGEANAYRECADDLRALVGEQKEGDR